LGWKVYHIKKRFQDFSTKIQDHLVKIPFVFVTTHPSEHRASLSTPFELQSVDCILH
jgi:two-component SAPR family response regulator